MIVERAHMHLSTKTTSHAASVSAATRPEKSKHRLSGKSRTESVNGIFGPAQRRVFLFASRPRAFSRFVSLARPVTPRGRKTDSWLVNHSNQSCRPHFFLQLKKNPSTTTVINFAGSVHGHKTMMPMKMYGRDIVRSARSVALRRPIKATLYRRRKNARTGNEECGDGVQRGDPRAEG